MNKAYPCWYCNDEPVGKFAIQTLYFKVQHPGAPGGARAESRINVFGVIAPLVQRDPVDATFYPDLCQGCLNMFPEVVKEVVWMYGELA